MKFLHTADLHLGRPVETRAPESPVGSALDEAPYRSLENLVNHALDQQVDAVLFAGDTLDFEWCTPTVIERFNDRISRLIEHDLEVYMAAGDADPAGHPALELPTAEGIHRFPPNDAGCFELNADAGSLRVLGASYDDTFELNRLLGEIAAEGSSHAGGTVGVLHTGPRGGTDSRAPDPVELPGDASIDYWALGHRHRTALLEQEASGAHPGSPQGRRPRESGLGGCLLVTMEGKSGPTLEFLPTSPLVWHRERIDLNAMEAARPETLDELADRLMKRADELRRATPEELARRKEEATGIACRPPVSSPAGYAVRWVVSGGGPVHERLREEENPEEVLEAQLRQEYRDRDPFLWTDSVHLATTTDRPGLDELARGDRIFAEFADLLEEHGEESLLSELEDVCGDVWRVTGDPETCDPAQFPLGRERLRGLLDQAIDRVTDRIWQGRNSDVD